MVDALFNSNAILEDTATDGLGGDSVSCTHWFVIFVLSWLGTHPTYGGGTASGDSETNYLIVATTREVSGVASALADH